MAKRGNVLAILGSPHQHGTSAQMMDCALDAARQTGWDVSQIWLYETNLAYCRGCGSCQQSGVCVINDDIQQISASIKKADRIILSAPTYWANVPGVVKNLFDRMFGAAMEKTAAFPKPRFSAHQRYLLLTSCSTPPFFCTMFNQSSSTLHAMHEFFKTGGMKPMGSVVCGGAYGQKEIPDSVRKKIQRVWMARHD